MQIVKINMCGIRNKLEKLEICEICYASADDIDKPKWASRCFLRINITLKRFSGVIVAVSNAIGAKCVKKYSTVMSAYVFKLIEIYRTVRKSWLS